MDKTNHTFTGTQSYIATDDLQLAVNAAMTLQKPLLIKGEPGTGKTLLAEEVAQSLGMPLITWHIKSTTKAEQGLSIVSFFILTNAVYLGILACPVVFEL